uniref:UDP-glycosyltransferase 1 n=1 Tax=Linum usitatissimum TaxID=4006 RepID=I2BHC8_LINUS|nr:UDP-glycosyltransferase 1 [Linum usitatissimum]
MAGNSVPPPPPSPLAHILVFPYPAQGHTLPLLDLIHHLLTLRRFSVTVVTTPKNLHSLSTLISLHHPLLRPLIFPFPHHHLLPAGVENVKDIGNSGNLPIVNALHKLSNPITVWFDSQPDPKPIALISDFFLGWTLSLSTRLGIPRFAFFSSGAFLASLTDKLFRDPVAMRNLDCIVFDELPGSPSFKAEHLPSMFRRYVPDDPDWELVREGVLSNLVSHGCIFNSFQALEGPSFDFLKGKMGHENVFAIGPVSMFGIDRNPNSSSSNVVEWLEHCQDGSVLYVCFGSQKLMSKDQMEALATGLEKSRVRFVWVVKPGSEESGQGVVPDGFEDRVSGKGIVVKGWVDQVTILGHRAVGGFLSHCGWNSVLEGVAAGVTILGWPMEADQFVNARLLVEDLGVAVRVCEGGDTVPDPVELGNRIAESMSNVLGERKGAEELKKKALTAIEEGGSSRIDLDRLVHQLHKLHSQSQNEIEVQSHN